jgi:hypothetical protein
MKIVNAPGKVTTSPTKVGRDARRWKRLPGVSFIFWSEMADEDRAAALHEDGDGFTITRESGTGEQRSKGECAIGTADKLRTVVKHGLFKLTQGGGRGRLVRPIYAPWVITRAPSGRKTLATMSHLPAHIETLWRRFPLPTRTKARFLLKHPRLSPAIRAWLEAVKEWKPEVMHLAAEHHVDDIIVAADWNLNAHAKWVEALVEHLWPGLHMEATKDPDLGKRTVGFVLTTMDMTDGEVLEAQSSDHNAGLYTLKHWNAPHPTPVPPKPKQAPDPFARCTYNGARMDNKTATAIRLGEKILGYALTVLQGCYNPGGVSASAGTHDGGGVIDFAPFEYGRKIKVFREMGWFIWHRPAIAGLWGEHIHGGIRNHGRLSPSAQRQQVDFDHYPTGKRNGLASHSIDPNQFPSTPRAFNYEKTWHDLELAA